MLGVRHLVSLLVLSSLVLAQKYTLHHRINPTSSWSTRGIITINEAGGIPSYEDLTGKARPWDALQEFERDSTRLYQLAITPEGVNTVSHDSPMTFARVCLLETDADESLTIHQSKEGVYSEAFGLSYDLIGLDASQLASNGCPIGLSTSTSGAKGFNIQVARPEAPLSPLPPKPPAVKKDGTVVAEGEEPPKEKSFLAKYWYYFVPILIIMAIPTEIADSNNQDNEEEGATGSDMFQKGAPKALGLEKGASR